MGNGSSRRCTSLIPPLIVQVNIDTKVLKLAPAYWYPSLSPILFHRHLNHRRQGRPLILLGVLQNYSALGLLTLTPTTNVVPIKPKCILVFNF